MKLTIGLLSDSKHQTLGTFLLHLDCEVLTSKSVTSFLSSSLSKTCHILFMDKDFLKSEQDYKSLRSYLAHFKTEERPRLVCLDEESRITKVPNSGSLSSEDFSVVKTVLDETLKLLSKKRTAADLPRVRDEDSLVFEDEEVVELTEEEVFDRRGERLTEAVLNIKKAQSLDELGVNLVWSLGRVFEPGRKAVYFKYLPTYCSLVALGGCGLSLIHI